MDRNLAPSITLATLLLAGAATLVAQRTPDLPGGVAPNVPAVPVSSSDILRQYDGALDAVVEKVLPAIVRIEVTSFGRPEDSKSGRDADVISRQHVLGSGVIVDPDGYIMTNAHVVVGAQRIRLTIVPTEVVAGGPAVLHQQRVYDAKLIGLDRTVDVALVKVDERGLPFIPLQEQFSVRLGQMVLAIGSPEGLDHTVTRGIVSAVGRQVDPDKPIHVQTDAPINPGSSSGGALIDRDGNLIGLNTFKITEGNVSEGLGFAIPEPVLRTSYQEFREHGHLRHPTIKAHAQAIAPDLAAGLKLPRKSGVVISDVVVGGPPEKAGIESGDVIARVDNHEVDSLPKFSAALLMSEGDHPIELEILRGSEIKQLFLLAVEGTKGTNSLADLIEPQNSLIVPLGVFVPELTDRIAEDLPGLRSAKGLIVAAKVDYTPKLDADLELGDIIRSINRVAVNRPEDLRAELARYQPGDAIVLEIEHKRVFQFTAFDME